VWDAAALASTARWVGGIFTSSLGLDIARALAAEVRAHAPEYAPEYLRPAIQYVHGRCSRDSGSVRNPYALIRKLALAWQVQGYVPPNVGAEIEGGARNKAKARNGAKSPASTPWAPGHPDWLPQGLATPAIQPATAAARRA